MSKGQSARASRRIPLDTGVARPSWGGMVDISPPDAAAAAEVYFDGACPICRREIAGYRSMAGMADVAWRDVSDPACAPEGLDRAAALARFHVRRVDGTVVSGARAFLAVWRRNPRLAWVARALDRRPFLYALDAGYAGFLRIRPLWRR